MRAPFALCWKLLALAACSPTVADPATVDLSAGRPEGPPGEGSRHDDLSRPDPRAGRHDPMAPPADYGRCLRSRMCQLEGYCSPGVAGLCVAASDDDCKPSDACLGGRCSARDGRCVASNDAECRSSWACKGYGRCDFDGDEACMATSAVDCARSTRCQRVGECRLARGECVR
jgi:hypothetical protein